MRVAVLVLITGVLYGQSTPALPSNWVGAGAAYPVAGWASYATLMSSKGQVYSFSSWDATVTKTRPHVIQSSARSGLATVLRTWGPVTLLGFAEAGVAAAQTTTTGAFSGGGVGVLKIGKTAWTIEVAVRVLKTPINGQQNEYELGTGRVGN